MKNCPLLLLFFVSLLFLASGVEGQVPKLDVPANWRSETVKLPPPFAPKVELKGKAQVYFSPGWGKEDSDEFFTYTFMFQTEADPKFDRKLIKKELLAYFGGLASAVSRGKVDPTAFKLDVAEVKEEEAKKDAEAKAETSDIKKFKAKLEWTEPFFTKSEQTLHLEIGARYDAAAKKNYLVVSVSPQDPASDAKASSKVWQQLRDIHGEYQNAESSAEIRNKKASEPVGSP